MIGMLSPQKFLFITLVNPFSGNEREVSYKLLTGTVTKRDSYGLASQSAELRYGVPLALFLRFIAQQSTDNGTN
ncbi:MAG TPA: hypothetical protein DIW81_22940 [Planctomycetaceae bacterium]|nr:hypothetical protein [Rubinisphaera sp.]HCS54402.1 hypothetical protein [Planctomycetaceae bacterium]